MVREIRVSVVAVPVFVPLQAQAAPEDLEREDWSDFDRDGDGALDAGERVPLLELLRRKETDYTAISVGEQPVALARFDVTALNASDASSLDATLSFRLQGRLELPSTGDLPFTLYDRPRKWTGAVPVRLSVARGLRVEGVQGARHEQRSPQRLDAVLTNPTPAVFGWIRR